jgi:NADPH:quinone reductase
MPDAEHDGSYGLVLESVGGESLARALSLVAPGGDVVTFGSSSGEATTFEARTLYSKHGCRVSGFVLFPALARTGSGAKDLGTLADQMATGRLRSPVTREAPWTDAAAVMADLMARRVDGKAVLHID